MQTMGLDIIEIHRIEQAIRRWGDHFLTRIYTEKELELCRKRLPSLAARFAGKEAVIKVLGASKKGFFWREIEILSAPSGQPVVRLYGKAKKMAFLLGLSDITVSLTHSKEYALAVATGGKAG